MADSWVRSRALVVGVAVSLLCVSGSRVEAAPCESLPIDTSLPQPEHMADDPREQRLLRCLAAADTEAALAEIRAGTRSQWAPAYAVAGGDGRALRALLEAGASPDAHGPYNDVPVLAMAARRGHGSLVELLLERGADPNRAGDAEFSGGSAIEGAVERGDLEILRLLLGHGAAPDLRESYHGRSPLWQLACRSTGVASRREMIALLVEHGADLEAADAGGMDGWTHSGRTPLACAVSKGDPELMRTLLSHRANVNALVDGGIRILELARREAPELVELLETHGATATRPLPSRAEVYAALDGAGHREAKDYYLLGARKINPKRRGAAFAETYARRRLVRRVVDDLDGDGRDELTVVLQRPGEKPPAIGVAVLGRGDAGAGPWRTLFWRTSVGGNPVVSAALEPGCGEVNVHVFEARYQCDDEQPVIYTLHREGDSIRTDEPGPHLHSRPRSWDCGE